MATTPFLQPGESAATSFSRKMTRVLAGFTHVLALHKQRPPTAVAVTGKGDPGGDRSRGGNARSTKRVANCHCTRTPPHARSDLPTGHRCLGCVLGCSGCSLSGCSLAAGQAWPCSCVPLGSSHPVFLSPQVCLGFGVREVATCGV